MKRRIVITGMGVVSCFGSDVDHFYEQLLNGQSGATLIDQFDSSGLQTRFACSIKNFDPGEYVDKKQARRADRAILFGMVAGKKAAEMAHLSTFENKAKAGVIIGSGMGGMSIFVDGVETMKEKGANRVTPFFVPFILTNMPGALLAMDLGLMGPNYSISTACATGNNSIIAAAEHIRKGEADLMITGGVEAGVIPMGMAGFNACKALSQKNEEPMKASRPWDQHRDGFVMGEGAGVLVLEELESALRRKAPIFAEYLGGGVSCDAYHMTEPHPEGKGVQLCIEAALKDANITQDQVDYINAHATSTPVGDMAEIQALKSIFRQPKKITINATKSMIGHSLGAAGGLESVVTTMAIHTGKIHPTINLDHPEPGLEFDVPTQATSKSIKVALSNSFGFGGHNATIVLGSYES